MDSEELGIVFILIFAMIAIGFWAFDWSVTEEREQCSPYTRIVYKTDSRVFRIQTLREDYDTGYEYWKDQKKDYRTLKQAQRVCYNEKGNQ